MLRRKYMPGLLFMSFVAGNAFAAYQVKLPAGIDGNSKPLVQDIAACRAEVDEAIAWGEESNQEEAVKLSALRKEHQSKKEKYIKKLQHMIDVTADWTNHERNKAYENAVKTSVKVLTECIQANERMYYPHNIALLIVPESVRIECYDWALTLPGLQDPE